MSKSERCIRCGECCRKAVCGFGQIVYGTTSPPCPGLRNNGDVWDCAIVMAEQAYCIDAFTRLIGIGMGCDYEDEAKKGDEREDQR